MAKEFDAEFVREYSKMRALPGIVGAVAVVAIGGAVAGAAIDTTPRQIHAETPLPGPGPITIDDKRRALGAADHYPLRANGKTYEVAELRERGLYSQERFAPRFAYSEANAELGEFDFDAAQAEALRWEAEQRRAIDQQRSYARRAPPRPAPRRPLELDRPARVAQPSQGQAITYVSRPVVQETSSATAR